MGKKNGLVLLLALLSGAASAEWSEIAGFDDGMRVFAEPATLRRNGEQAELTHLVRWPEAQIEPGVPAYRSTVVRSLYDCAARRQKYLGSSSYAGVMGNGARVAVDGHEAERWDTVSEDSMEEKLWQIACGAR